MDFTRQKTPPALLSRAPLAKEAQFWKERVHKEAVSSGLGTEVETFAPELPWVAAASLRCTRPMTGAVGDVPFKYELTQGRGQAAAPQAAAAVAAAVHTTTTLSSRPGRERMMPPHDMMGDDTASVASHASAVSSLSRAASSLSLSRGASGSPAAHAAASPKSAAGSTHSRATTMREHEVLSRIAALEDELAAERAQVRMMRYALRAATHASSTTAGSLPWVGYEAYTEAQLQGRRGSRLGLIMRAVPRHWQELGHKQACKALAAARVQGQAAD